MTEQEFLESIDLRFPYRDESAWRALIDQGRAYSSNANYGVLLEVVRLPRGLRVARRKRHAMVDYWRDGFEHPLAAIVTACARAQIDERAVEIPLVLSIMRRVGRYPDEYCALTIVEMAAFDLTTPLAAFDIIDHLSELIRTRWRAGGQARG